MDEVIDDVSIIDLLEFVIENDICSVSVEIERDDLLWWLLVPSDNCNCVTDILFDFSVCLMVNGTICVLSN